MTSRRGIKQLEISFSATVCFFYFPMKVVGGHIHRSRENFRAPPLNESPEPLLQPPDS